MALNVGVGGGTKFEASLPLLANCVCCTGEMITKQFLQKQEVIADLYHHTKEHNSVHSGDLP